MAPLPIAQAIEDCHDAAVADVLQWFEDVRRVHPPGSQRRRPSRHHRSDRRRLHPPRLPRRRPRPAHPPGRVRQGRHPRRRRRQALARPRRASPCTGSRWPPPSCTTPAWKPTSAPVWVGGSPNVPSPNEVSARCAKSSACHQNCSTVVVAARGHRGPHRRAGQAIPGQARPRTHRPRTRRAGPASHARNTGSQTRAPLGGRAARHLAHPGR